MASKASSIVPDEITSCHEYKLKHYGATKWIKQEIQKFTAVRRRSPNLNPVRESPGLPTGPTPLTPLSPLPPLFFYCQNFPTTAHFCFTHQSLSTSSLEIGPSSAACYSRAPEPKPNTHLKDPNLNVESLRESSDDRRENSGDGEGFCRRRTLWTKLWTLPCVLNIHLDRYVFLPKELTKDPSQSLSIHIWQDPLYNERNGMYIGQGIAMMSRAGIFRASERVAVDMKNRVYRLPSFNDVLQGEIFLQNRPSVVTAHALDSQKGERIVDICAAPGGKTTAIVILLKDEGEIVAADRSHNKVLDIQKLAAELGLNCITTYKLDALKSVCKSHELSAAITSNTGDSFKSDATNQNSSTAESQIEKVQADDIAGLSMRDVCNVNVRNEKSRESTYASRAEVRKSMRRMRNGPGRNQCKGTRVENSKGFLPHSFDRVLLDAPCSALGLRPRLFSGEETIESLRNHAKYQRRMFDQAVQLARPGGVIVYSTCTINPGENEALVRYALDTYKFLSLVTQHPRVGGPGLVGSFEYSDGYIEEWLKPGEEELVQRFDPSAPLDTIGFFIAKFMVNKET